MAEEQRESGEVRAVRILRYDGPAAWVDRTLQTSEVQPSRGWVLGERLITEIYRDWRAPTGENAGTDWVYSQLRLRLDGLLPVEIGGPLREISVAPLPPLCAIRECYGEFERYMPGVGPLCAAHRIIIVDGAGAL